MRLITSLSAAVIAAVACVAATTASAAPIVASKAAIVDGSAVVQAGFLRHRRVAVKAKSVTVRKAKKKMKRYVASYKHCGTYKFRKGGRGACVDARGPALVWPARRARSVRVVRVMHVRAARPAREVRAVRVVRAAPRARMMRAKRR